LVKIQKEHNPLPLGDLVASIAQPVARAADAVLGTNIRDCAPCKKRHRRWNRAGKRIAEKVKRVGRRTIHDR